MRFSVVKDKSTLWIRYNESDSSSVGMDVVGLVEGEYNGVPGFWNGENTKKISFSIALFRLVLIVISVIDSNVLFGIAVDVINVGQVVPDSHIPRD
jgi:hypothetical protein